MVATAAPLDASAVAALFAAGSLPAALAKVRMQPGVRPTACMSAFQPPCKVTIATAFVIGAVTGKGEGLAGRTICKFGT